MGDVRVVEVSDADSMVVRETDAALRRLLVDDVSSADAAGFALPTGTVSFLLTDVEGSSQRWERAPAAMALAIPRHYEILDEVVARHGGVRPVEQGEGDSVVAAFARASDAVAAAVDAQRLLTAEPWPAGAELHARMAIHTGEAQLRDEGNYFGQTVIRCARLRAVGHGDQILVSDAAAGLVVDQLPEGVILADLGSHRLKDLGRPERVWMVVHPDLPAAHAPLRSLDVHRHNLPVQLTPLIGRVNDVAALAQLVNAERLVTLTGSGGVGKTRLALAVAAELVEQVPGGVWFVELAGVTDPAAVGSAVLAAMGAHSVPGLQPVEQLIAAMSQERTLVVLDNCEHLVQPCAALAAGLLEQHAAVSVLATAREPLGVPGEVTWQVQSLSAPPPETIIAVPALSQFDAVRLFIDRARRARPTFVVSDANAPAIAQVCYRLDGIPLALELAAARCRQMSVERIATELDDRFHLLTGGARTVLPRQQTLAASVDWSYDRLDEIEKVLFRRLGVFAGTFPTDAAENVAAAIGDIDPVTVFDVLSRLVDKSLVVTEEANGGNQQYRLLETLRAYAIERARAAGELEALRDSQVTFWLDWLDRRESIVHTDAVIEHLEMFHDSVAAALGWSTRDPALGLRLLRLLARAWQGSARPQAALTAVDRLLTDEHAERFPIPWAAAAASVAVLVRTARSWPDAAGLLLRGRAVADEAGDDYFVALSDMLLGFTAENCDRVRRLAREQGQRYVECIATMARAQVAVREDPSVASAMLDDADLRTAARESRYLRDFADRTAGRAALYLGDLERCLGLARGLCSSPSLLMAESAVRLLGAAGLLACDESAVDTAAAVAHERLGKVPGTQASADVAIHQRSLLAGGPALVDPGLQPEHIGTDDPLQAYSLMLLCREAVDAGEAVLAVEAVQTWPAGFPPERAVQATIEATATQDEDRWHAALSIASEHGLRLVAVDALEGLAGVAATSESWAECLRLAAAAARLRDETGYRWRFAFEQGRLDAAVAAAAEALGPDRATTATAEGAALAWREAAAYAGRARGERQRPSHGWAALTPTELRVVALVADGLTNPQVAERLLMGRATVKTHLDHVFTKTGLHSRTELVAAYVRRHPGVSG
jgi:predicted ATPase/class 3 adenylate cyclase/DNA-binding CsgD family transcriptional regulator